MISKRIEVSLEQSFTTGVNSEYQKNRLFVSLGVEPEAGEVREEVAGKLYEEARRILNAQFEIAAKATKDSVIQAAAVKREAMADNAEASRNASNVPVVTATKRAPITTTVYAGSGNHIAGLSVGAVPKGTTLNVTVATQEFKDGDKPRIYGTLEDDSGSIGYTIWGKSAPFKVGDNVTIQNPFRVTEYNSKLQLDFGKYAEITVQ